MVDESQGDDYGVLASARRARGACTALSTASRDDKDAALLEIADELDRAAESILEANRRDVGAARASGTPESLLDRLALTESRLEAVSEAVRQVVGLDDPVGEVIRGYRLANGLVIRQVRVPLGVIAVIYEARPNVTVDAAALALKSGNAVLLRGSSSAAESNAALVGAMRTALARSAVPVDSIQLVPDRSRESVRRLMRARGLVDVIIPRGGAELINSVVEGSTVPVIETGVGNCHVYVDAGADVHMAVGVLLNAKVQRPSVCNAAETVIVHDAIAERFWDAAMPALTNAGVTLHGDRAVQAAGAARGVDVEPANEGDWAAEYLSLDLAAIQVPDIGAAIAHIRRWSSGHTEAIITDSMAASTRFVAEIDSAAVMVNASTRFSDGEQFGFGAEIGISTQKLHARGPMGLREMTSAKFVVVGRGHVRDGAAASASSTAQEG